MYKNLMRLFLAERHLPSETWVSHELMLADIVTLS